MNQEQEEWLPVVGYRGYEVSNLGRVRSYFRPGGRGFIHTEPFMLATHLNNGGYLCLSLMTEHGRCIKKMVHRLVAMAFLASDYKSTLEVNHIDSNRGNPNVTNLEWITRGQNCIHASRHGHGSKPKLSLEQREEVMRLCVSGLKHSAIRSQFKIGAGLMQDLSRAAKNQVKIQPYLHSLRAGGLRPQDLPEK